MKTIFLTKKLFRLIFCRIIEYNKLQGTKVRGLQAFVTGIVQALRSFLQHLRGRWRQFLKNGYFPEEKHFWPIFSRITDYRVSQTSSNILLGSARYYVNHCVSYKIISVTPKMLLKTQIFDKEDYFSIEKIIPADFFSYYRV